VAVWATDRWLAGVPPVAEPGGLLETVAGRAVRVFGAIGVGIATLALVAHALRLEEFRQVTARVLARLRR
jgi:hypothetical protein